LENRSQVVASSESFFTSIGVRDAAPNETSVEEKVSTSLGTKFKTDDDDDDDDEEVRANEAGLGAVKASEVDANKAKTENAVIFMVQLCVGRHFVNVE